MWEAIDRYRSLDLVDALAVPLFRWVGCQLLAAKSPRAGFVAANCKSWSLFIGRVGLFDEGNKPPMEGMQEMEVSIAAPDCRARPNANFGIACRGALATAHPTGPDPLSLAAAADLTTLVPHRDPTLSLCNLLCPPLPSLFVQSLLCHLFLLILGAYRQLGHISADALRTHSLRTHRRRLAQIRDIRNPAPTPHPHPPWRDDST